VVLLETFVSSSDRKAKSKTVILQINEL